MPGWGEMQDFKPPPNYASMNYATMLDDIIASAGQVPPSDPEYASAQQAITNANTRKGDTGDNQQARYLEQWGKVAAAYNYGVGFASWQQCAQELITGVFDL